MSKNRTDLLFDLINFAYNRLKVAESERSEETIAISTRSTYMLELVTQIFDLVTIQMITLQVLVE